MNEALRQKQLQELNQSVAEELTKEFPNTDRLHDYNLRKLALSGIIS